MTLYKWCIKDIFWWWIVQCLLQCLNLEFSPRTQSTLLMIFINWLTFCFALVLACQHCAMMSAVAVLLICLPKVVCKQGHCCVCAADVSGTTWCMCYDKLLVLIHIARIVIFSLFAWLSTSKADGVVVIYITSKHSVSGCGKPHLPCVAALPLHQCNFNNACFTCPVASLVGCAHQQPLIMQSWNYSRLVMHAVCFHHSIICSDHCQAASVVRYQWVSAWVGMDACLGCV
jgi:hypothetical protein